MLSVNNVFMKAANSIGSTVPLLLLFFFSLHGYFQSIHFIRLLTPWAKQKFNAGHLDPRPLAALGISATRDPPLLQGAFDSAQLLHDAIPTEPGDRNNSSSQPRSPRLTRLFILNSLFASFKGMLVSVAAKSQRFF